ncbi:hypothetical protein [Bdellovibrio bacteriovorus]|uniref:hypothetical protein n=1 Tax=Bdellovibrio TaxID=958 RepID=UPI0035A9642F
MKNAFIISILATLVGCSFSKKSSVNENGTPQSRVDEVLQDSRYSVFEKLHAAIGKGDSQLFYAVLPKATKADLNSLSSSGQSLGEYSIYKNQIDFLVSLLKAGASPYRPTRESVEGLKWTAMVKTNKEAEDIIKTYQRKLLAEASLVCFDDNVEKTISFLEENYLKPTYKVCGDINFFQYSFIDNPVDTENAELILKTYLKQERELYEDNLGEIFYNAFVAANKEIIGGVDRYLNRHVWVVEIEQSNKFPAFIQKAPLDKVLTSYAVLKSCDLKTKIIRPTPPPPPGYKFTPEELERAGFVTYVKDLIKDRISQIPLVDRESMAQQLQELGLD